MPEDLMAFFFFSSRRRHTRCLSDWSSDVCSSDLITGSWEFLLMEAARKRDEANDPLPDQRAGEPVAALTAPTEQVPVGEARSEERRVGKEGRARGAATPEKKRIEQTRKS